jgi:hypothetical protein
MGNLILIKKEKLKTRCWSDSSQNPKETGIYKRIYIKKDGDQQERYSIWNGEKWSIGKLNKENLSGPFKASKKKIFRWMALSDTVPIIKKEIPKERKLVFVEESINVLDHAHHNEKSSMDSMKIKSLEEENADLRAMLRCVGEKHLRSIIFKKIGNTEYGQRITSSIHSNPGLSPGKLGYNEKHPKRK